MKKSMNCKRLIFILVLLLSCSWCMAACASSSTKEPDETEEVEDTVIKASDSAIIEGEARWQKFLESVQSGVPDKITIEQTLGDHELKHEVEYRDGIYYYGVDEPVGYQYLLKLEGTMPGSKGAEASLFILTNEMCDFDEFARRFASSIEPLDYRFILWFTVQPD